MIAVYIHPKISNHLRSHLRAKMALDYSRLGLENELLDRKQIRPNFLLSTSLPNTILPTNLGTCKPTFRTFYTSHLRWNSTMRRCFYPQTSDKMQYFTIFQDKLHSFNIQNRLLNKNKYKLNVTCLSIFEAFFLKVNKKRIALICFIEITSILAHAKTQLNQAVKGLFI